MCVVCIRMCDTQFCLEAITCELLHYSLAKHAGCTLSHTRHISRCQRHGVGGGISVCSDERCRTDDETGKRHDRTSGRAGDVRTGKSVIRDELGDVACVGMVPMDMEYYGISIQILTNIAMVCSFKH